MRKVDLAAAAQHLQQLPNIGPSIAGDLRSIGVLQPQDLVQADPYALYVALCQHTRKRHDPCWIDCALAAVDFMRGAPPRAWWDYTAERKQALALAESGAGPLALAARWVAGAPL